MPNLIARTPLHSLPESVMKELKSALTEQLKQPESPTPELSALIKRVAREARDKNVRPEELLISFKELWNSLAEVVGPQAAHQFEPTRQNLVTLCIKAYYAE